jgi:large subunit ribosomal protein L25
MERIEIEAVARPEVGKGPSRALRRKGLIPAVIYGPKMQNAEHIAVDPRAIIRILHSGENVLVDLKIRDNDSERSHLVMLKAYDVHPVKEQIRHADFLEISLEEAIRVEVPLVFTGKPVGVERGGILSPQLRTLEISCLPEKIPHEIEVDCSALDIGDTLHVSDLKLPPYIEVVEDPDTAVVTVAGVEMEEEEAAPEEEEIEGPAEEEESEE